MTKVCLALCLLVLAVTRAAADPAAEQLFRDGRTLLKSGKVDLACEKFQQSRDIEAKFGTVLNLADCRERQGKTATAWELFLEAKALAERQKGPADVAEAVRRAKKIEGKRAFLTIVVPEDVRRIPGLVVTRNGVPVPEATWGTALPIDPGTYAIATAVGAGKPASVSVDVVAEGKVTATALAPELPPPPPAGTGAMNAGPGPAPGPGPRAELPPPAIEARADAGPAPGLRTFGVGIAFGATSDGDLTPGARVMLQRPMGPGALRGLFTLQYAHLANDTTSPYDNASLFAFGLGAEYLFAWKPGYASAGGLGVGIDYDTGPYDDDATTRKWAAARVSPFILRFGSPRLELGLHAVVILQSSPILIGTVALDWFVR